MADRQKAAIGWHREDIRSALRKKFGNLTSLSVDWGYAPNAITQALGARGWAGIERRIAEALEVSPHALWPNRWTPEGTRRSPNAIAGEPTAPASRMHRQKSEAA